MFKNTSELRQDIVTGDWIVIATGRMKRPEHYAQKVLPYGASGMDNPHESDIETQDIDREQILAKCPFDNLETSGNKGVVLRYPTEKDWFIKVIPNKYPAFKKSETLTKKEEGPYRVMDGVGFHEVIIYRDHFTHVYDFSADEVTAMFDVYQKRYLALMNRKFIDYISIFHNYGREAGASLDHPHSQLIATPIVPPDIHRSIEGSTQYYHAHKRCVHCLMIEWEKEDRKRVIFENDDFIAFCPFVSRAAFEIRIFPKDHKPYFERITAEEKQQLADALSAVLKKVYHGLRNSAFNFFIHTSPCDGKTYSHYHWHLEVIPKTSVWAGFELSTGVEISTVSPEQAAKFLRKS